MKIKLIVIFYICIFIGKLFSHSGDTLNVNYGSSPVIDGTISTGEWDDATSFVFYGYNSVIITCYIKHNGLDTLFVAQDVPEMIGGDHGYIWFDLLNNGSTSPQTDDYWLSRYYFVGLPTVEAIGTGTSWGAWTSPSGWIVEHTGDGWSYDHGQMEFAISYNKLNIVQGIPKTIGFMIGFGDNPAQTDCWFWPSSGIYNNPNTWGDIISPDNWGSGASVEEETGLIRNNVNISLTNYPNPFNGETTIEFNINTKQNVSLIIYNINGQIVKQFDFLKLYNERNDIMWNCKDNNNLLVPNGIYFYQLRTNNRPAITKMMLFIK